MGRIRSRLVRISTLVIGLVVALAVVTACGGGDGSPEGAAGEGTATVVRAVDGDTLVVDIDGREERVRLIGIDTPESTDPGQPVECFGAEATARIEALLPAGSPVRLERDVEARDRYDRLLAYVFRQSDDLFVNAAMVQDGFAEVLTIAPNVAYVGRFTDAARTARTDSRGLWSSCEEAG